MIKKFIFPLILLLLCASSVFAHDDYDKEYVEGEIIVVIDNSYSDSGMGALSLSTYSEALNAMAESFAESAGLESLGTFAEIRSVSNNMIVHLRSESKNTGELIAELANNPNVKSVQPNYIRHHFNAAESQVTNNSILSNSEALIPDDTHFEELWGMQNIGMPQVWEHATGSGNICVAVIDSGIDYHHPDLNANMARDSYGNYGRLFRNGVQSSNPVDTLGHGTHVAGIIGAVGNNGIGVTGVNWSVSMLAVNVMPNGSAVDSDVIAGINYILSEKKAGLNIRVVNMSFGGWEAPIPSDSPFGAAIKSLSDAGILCVMAVGNDSQNISSPDGKFSGKLVYPACFRFANTLAVGSMGADNTLSSYSNHSSSWVDVAAPGEKIYSTLMNDRYGTMEGTSMSAAHVSGAGALLFAAFPNETVGQIKERITRGARKTGYSLQSLRSGFLDVAGAYGIETEPETDEPMTSVSITGDRNITLGGSSIFSQTKDPNNANGSFEYSWETSDESVVVISGTSTPSIDTLGISTGSSTLTLSVTQTLQDGTKITKTDSIGVSVKNRFSESSSGCNFGLFSICLLMLLPFFKRQR